MTVAVSPWAPFRHRVFFWLWLGVMDPAPYPYGPSGTAQRTWTTDALGRLISAHAATTGN